MRYFFSILLYFMLSTSAYAYIDPGTGSALVTFLVGLIVGASVILKSFWFKIRGLFFKNKQDNDKKD